MLTLLDIHDCLPAAQCFKPRDDQQTFYVTLPVFVLPDFEPLDKVLSALESGVQAVLLTFETGHILHGDTINTWEKLGMSGSEEKMDKQEETGGED